MKKLKGCINIGAILLTFVLSFATGVAKDFVLTHLKNLKKPVVSQIYHNHSQTYHNHQGKTKKNDVQ